MLILLGIVIYTPFGFQSAIQPMERLPKLVDLLQFLLHWTSNRIACNCNQNFSQEWQRHVSRVIWGQHTTVSIKTKTPNFAFENSSYILPYHSGKWTEVNKIFWVNTKCNTEATIPRYNFMFFI